ncbi:LysR family transcriptional regulator [Paraburkholderia sp. J76]|uniref:LysR family transcriptional regulator n=1 Tax=Paraburkholderia sp. J76 TaxID=2805439 RepID=UPI002ABDFEB9|nr:LysR family transcriptional regulator [Paraburkholderia sp. J76]
MHGTALRYFLAVAQTGSLSGASGEIHVTISAISRKISALEAEVGTRLFERASHGMRLTAAGQILLAHARRTVLESDAVLNQIAALRGPSLNEIRIAASESLAQILLPEAMAEFRRHNTQTRFIMYVARPSEAARRIADGEVDVAVNFSVEHARGVAVRHSWRSPVYAVMAKTHPLAERPSIELEALLAYPLALADGQSTTRLLLERSCGLESIPVQMNIALESNITQALMRFVASSDAITFAGRMSFLSRPGNDGLVAKVIRNTEFQSRNLQIQTLSGRCLPPHVRAFIDLLKTRIDEADALTGT